MNKQINYLIITELLNITKTILEIIHPNINNCCRYVNQTLLTSFDQGKILMIKILTYCADWFIKLNICFYYCKFNQKCIDMPGAITSGTHKYNL